MPQDIESLPDFPALQLLERALWGTSETHGAAVLVGAGFSLNADLAADNAKKPPTWNDFCAEMAKQLYPTSKPPADPLRLAEEYRAALGQSALDSVIHELVRDREYMPGQLHRKLVALPWSDILTTNWDTLLERAAESELRRSYEVVRNMADIPRARSPRIVKLHGSMPGNGPFIFAEEDYRTYPRQFAPFVNLVQQVLLENELCLVGFSGEDPNFLQWSGWVRDQLGDAARRILLVGALALTPARRAYLEGRRIIPIDLSPLVETVSKDERHRTATERFLEYLTKAKPIPASTWPADRSMPRIGGGRVVQSSQGDATSRVAQTLATWSKQRAVYPGWLVCPHQYRLQLRMEVVEADFRLREAFKSMQEQERSELLYEVIWRLDHAFVPLFQWIRELPLAETLRGASSLTRQQRCAVALSLLRAALEDANRSRFDEIKSYLGNEGTSLPDVVAASHFQSALWSAREMDFDGFSHSVKAIEGIDPAWKLRKAALQCEIGGFESAAHLVQDALNELRHRHSRDRKSIWLISRLAWATFFGRSFLDSALGPSKRDLAEEEDDSMRFRSEKCDPWEEMSLLEHDLDERFRKHMDAARRERPLFDAGTYQMTVSLFGTAPAYSAYEMESLVEVAGIPTSNGFVDVMRSRLASAYEIAESRDDGDLSAVIRLLSSPSDRLMNKVFNRIEIAKMPHSQINVLTKRLLKSIDHARAQIRVKSIPGRDDLSEFWIGRAEVFLELLSRLVPRSAPDDAHQMFRFAATLMRDDRILRWNLFEPLGHLLSRSLHAIPPANYPAEIVEALNIPLPDERGVVGTRFGPQRNWPEVAEQFRGKISTRPNDESSFTSRINTLIEKVRTGDALTRERAVLRILYLYEGNILDARESRRFGDGLWSRRSVETGLPDETGLLPHSFLALPAPDPKEAETAFRSKIVDRKVPVDSYSDYFHTILGATVLRSDGKTLFTLSVTEALEILDLSLGWRPKHDPLGFDRHDEHASFAIGAMLAEGVLPVLQADAIGDGRLQKLLALARQEVIPSISECLPAVLRLFPQYAAQAASILNARLWATKTELVVPASKAVRRWCRLASAKSIPPCPDELKDRLVSIVINEKEAGLVGALQVVTSLIEEGFLSGTHKSHLADALGRLRVSTAYEGLDLESPRATTLTLVRGEAFVLSQVLQKAGCIHAEIDWWLQNGPNDPMPEVRFALHSTP